MTAKWYNHVPEKVAETDQVQILWDFNIQTDHVIEHVVVLNLRQRRCVILGAIHVHVAVPGDLREASKEMERSKSLKTWPGKFVRFGR